MIDHLSAHSGEDAFRNRSWARHLEKVPARLVDRVLHRIVLFESHFGAEADHPQSDCGRKTASTVRRRSLPSFPDHSMA